MNETGSTDYYKILGVNPEAPLQEIKDAFRKLALQYHPDRNQDNPEATDRMTAVNEAYAVLSDPAKRKEYDTIRNRFGPEAYGRFRQSYSQEDIFRGSDIHTIFDELSRTFGFRNFEDLFKEFSQNGGRTFEFRGPGYQGRGYVFTSGAPGKTASPPPLFRRGLGKLISYGLKKTWGIDLPSRGPDRHDTLAVSQELAEAGGRIEYFQREFSKKLLVHVPPETKEGRQLRLKGMGGLGKGGAEPGDLYLKIRVTKPLAQKFGKALDKLRGTFDKFF